MDNYIKRGRTGLVEVLKRCKRWPSRPYLEYSAVFFDGRYRVLRGGSWATHPLLARPTFRNWNLPERRQIFAGLRTARDG